MGPSTSGNDRHLDAWIDAPQPSADPPDRDRVHGHPQVACQNRGLLGIERVGAGRLVVAVGQEDENLLLRGGDQKCIEPPRNRVADVRAVVARPRRPHRADRFQQKRVIEDGADTPVPDNWQTRPGRSGRRNVLRRSA